MRPSRKMLIPAEGIVQFDLFRFSKEMESRRTFSHRERHRDDTVHRGHAVEDTDEVGEVVGDGQVVLDGDNVDFGAEEGTDDAGGVETLLNVEVGRRLVEHVAAERRR